ncbi:four helix bundle protein [Allomuricauda sp. d1]|uniref:four helix bundle protein n=1 Tax=Allomuricauda sp. d1 TaxID=3136725 RepID=UPI0031DE8AFE
MKFYELLAYQKSFDLGMEIFEMTKSFPKEEIYSLTDQIRRSSRSVSGNVAEAYVKRRYPRHFISKLTDSDGENLETQNWLRYSFACDYIEETLFKNLISRSEEVGKLIHYMINNPGKFGSKENYN